MTFGADTLKENVMKKYFFICLTALAVMNVSCVKENPSPTDEVTNTEKTLSLKAAAPADVAVNVFGTRTSMAPEGEGYAVNWSENDAISVNGKASNSIEIAADNAKSATFAVPGTTAPCCAVYPAAVASGFNAESAVVTLPAGSINTFRFR